VSGVGVMATQHAAYLFALAVGIVSSGIIANGWAMVMGEPPRLADLLDRNPTLLTPLRVLAALFSAPTAVLLDGFWWLIEQPIFGVPIIAAGLVWSFLQGVFILTQVFGMN
jgi:hypothetical protein